MNIKVLFDIHKVVLASPIFMKSKFFKDWHYWLEIDFSLKFRFYDEYLLFAKHYFRVVSFLVTDVK